MWTVEERTQLLTYNVGSYTLGTDIVDLIEHMVQIPATSQTTRYNLTRVSISTQAQRTNPGILGRPTEIYIDRLQPAPVVHLWPLPGDQGPFTLVYWVLRRIEDAGAFSNTGDFPFRFLPAFIAGLAFYIAQKKQPDNVNLLSRLENDYEKTWQRAAEEDREKATLKMIPRGSSYRVRQ